MTFPTPNYCSKKMKKLCKQDAMVRFVVKDLQKAGNTEETALHATYTGYVLEDSGMVSIYNKI